MEAVADVTGESRIRLIGQDGAMDTIGCCPSRPCEDEAEEEIGSDFST